MKKKNNLTLFIFFIFVLKIFTESSLPKNVEQIIKEAFAKKTPQEICKTLEIKIQKLNSEKEKQLAFSILADYEERCEFFAQAENHYQEAAKISSPYDKKILLIKAMGAALLADDVELAHSICKNSLLAKINNPLKEEDAKILIFYEWIKLKLIDTDENYSFQEIIDNLKKYVTNSSFKKFHPAILLSLWWLDNDKKAENTLLKKFPNSIEAGIVKGSAILAPKPFWYLMPRKAIAEENKPEEKALNAKTQDTSPSNNSHTNMHIEESAKIYQAGVFQNKENAISLSNELRKKGFTVVLKSKKGKEAILYSVLVKVDNKGDLVLRLKNEGFEPVPIF